MNCPAFFGGWQLNAAGRFLCIGKAERFCAPQQDIKKGGLRRAGEGTRSTEPKKERDQRLTGALPGRIHRAPRARLFHIPAR